ncbi:MAG: FCD domain-containing protein [Acidimicrobiia bacterium]|nr:FCD domain-containing protein [Acidimicrobiia bacterium]
MPTDQVVDRLRHEILDGVFSPGERLIEVELSERYQCGRAAIRAALVQLETEVLVDRRANRGAVVRRIPVSEAIEITEARRALEGLIATAAARRGTEEEFVELERILLDMQGAVALGDASSYATLNRHLHQQLMSMSRHSVASELVRNLRNRGVQNQFRLAAVPGRQADSLDQHAAIVDAVVKGDEDAAARAMGEHLDSVIEVLATWDDVRDRSG